MWESVRSPSCSSNAVAPECFNRDHPSFLAALGLLPGRGIERAAMRRTLAAVVEHWDMRQIWGWDLPMMAMTAARLGDTELAVDLLLRDEPNFRFGRAGMTPRVQYDPSYDSNDTVDGARKCSAGKGFRCVAEAYFPSNGALLLAVGMMAAGWDGQTAPQPGFPGEGWVVRSEGLIALP